jgi:hypothetical protein
LGTIGQGYFWGPRQFHTHIEKQDLGLGVRCERNRSLVRETCAVAGRQNQVAQCDLSMYEVQPRLTPWRELMDHVLPGVQYGRVHQGVLVDAQGSFASVG